MTKFLPSKLKRETINSQMTEGRDLRGRWALSLFLPTPTHFVELCKKRCGSLQTTSRHRPPSQDAGSCQTPANCRFPSLENDATLEHYAVAMSINGVQQDR